MRNDSIFIGEILRRAREDSGYTQTEIADRLGIGRDAILRIEKGSRKITADELQQLVRIYNMSIEDFLLEMEETNVSEVKGIILAGGFGTRLYPITKAVSKQLLPVYDKPMIYYPLSTLMQAGIRDILVITTKEDKSLFEKLLGDGSKFGIKINYATQDYPNGLAEAFIIGEKFIGDNPCAMVLGDNLFYGSGIKRELKQAAINASNGIATIFGYQVKDPERFGVMELDNSNNVLSIEEKPENPKSDYAVTGLYFYPKGVSKVAKKVKPSARNELEITALNELYLKDHKLKARLLGEGYSWFDAGTFDSYLNASNMVRTIEDNREQIISSPEKIALDNKWLSKEEIQKIKDKRVVNSYDLFINREVNKYE